MSWCKYAVYLLFLVLHVISEDIDEYLGEENFNKTWIYMGDDDGNLHKAIIDPLYQEDNSSLYDISARENRLKRLDLKTIFILYTRKLPKGKVIYPDELQYEHGINYSLPTKILVHGWRSNGSRTISRELKNAYLKMSEYNVVVYDWSSLANSFWYTKALWNTENLGSDLAIFVDNLICRGADPKKVHIIGHSVGAHIAGVAGRKLEEEEIGRVTGLDPAGPLYTFFPNSRISWTSAQFVDVIHSAIGTMGYAGSLGTVDFYPNGGVTQPGCGNRDSFWGRSACYHEKAWRYFQESIYTRKRYPAFKCRDYEAFQENNCEKKVVYMGNSVDTRINGTYYLNTKHNRR